jgi:TetR/AcrR family transcriptional repressor of nem operon
MTDKISHKEKTRARILDVAAEALREHGADGISVANLMKRAGLTHGGFYAHFENRDDLVTHAIDRMFESSRTIMTRNMDGVGPAEGLAALIDDYLSDRRIEQVARGCPMPPLLGEVARMPAAARARFEQGVEAFRLRLEGALEALGHREADLLSRSVFAEMIGAAILARASPRREDAQVALAASRERLKARLGLDAKVGSGRAATGNGDGSASR